MQEYDNKSKAHVWAFDLLSTIAYLYVQNIVDRNFLKLLGNRVRELRLNSGLTQEDLGFMVGNSGKQIGRIERGEHNVTSCMLYQISKALGIKLKDLFDFTL
ncbi:MAG: helix-turn-helix transcriptional regulator [Bacteroidia bacterium]